MGLYAFELGRVKNLCLAELNSVLGEENFVEMVWEFAIFDLKKDQDFEALQNKLGGTIKIAEVIDTIDRDAKNKDIEESIETILTENLKDASGKIPFAISAISIHGDSRNFLKFFLNFSKKILKSFDLNCRFVNKPWMNPSPAQVYKSKAIQKGIDLTIIRGKSLYIAKSITIQNIDAYSVRDFDKPFRDARMGMLPPKLAQIMINLAPNAKLIFDPFCGSGTILMEALLQGKSAGGSDIDEKAVDGTKKNIEWLKENFPKALKAVKNEEAEVEVSATDAKNLNLPKEVDTIVTEGYLGLPASHILPPQEREKRFDEIAKLHSSWLKNLKHPVTIVLSLPAFALGNSKHDFFPNPKEFFANLGFQILNKETLVYDREDQIIAREIVILKKI